MFRYGCVPKIRLHEKLTNEIFYRRKFPELRYISVVVIYLLLSSLLDFPDHHENVGQLLP